MDIADLRVVVGADVSDADHALDALGTKVESFGSTFGRVFTVAAAAGTAALVAGLGSAINEASTFEKTMSGVAAVSGASGAEMKRLSDLALKLGADTSFSAGEAGKGIEELVKAGVSVGDVMGGAAKASLDLAAAGGISVADAATIASNAMNQFSIKGKDLAGVADLIAGAANASAIDVGQFQYSLAAVGTVAATVGLSFKDTAVAIAEMGQAGIVGSDAGTSLKTMLLALQPSTKAATDEFKKLGLITASGSNQFFDAQGHIKSLADVQAILQKATKGMTDQQRLATLQMLFGTDAVRAAAVLSKDGAQGFNDMAAAMGKVSAADVAEKRLDNLSGSIEKLTGSLSTVAISVGLALTPAIRKVVDQTNAMVNAWTPAITAFANHIPAAIAATIARVTVLWGSMVHALQPAIQWVIGHATAFKDAFLGAAAGISAFLAWQGAVAVIGAVGGALTALLSPIALLAAAGAALGIAWANNWLGIREITASVIGWITGTGFPSMLAAMQAVVTWLQATWRPTLTATWDFLRTQLGGTLTLLTTTVWPAFQGAMAVVRSWITGSLAPTLTSLRGWLADEIGVALTWATTIGWPALQSAVAGVVGWLTGTAVPALSGVWDWLSSKIGGALTWLTGTGWPLALGAMQAVVAWFQATWQPVVIAVWYWISTQLGGALTTLTTTVWPAFQGAMLGVWTWLTGTFMPALASLRDWLGTRIGDALGWLIQKAWPDLQAAMAAVWTWTTGSLIPTLSTLWDWLSPKLSAALGWLTTSGWPLMQLAATAVWNWLNASLFPTLSQWYDWLQARLSPVYTWFITYGWPKLQEAGAAVWTWLTTALFPTLSEWWDWLQARLSPVFQWFITYGWPTLQSAGAAFWTWLTTTLIPGIADWWHWLEEKTRPSAEWWIQHGFPDLGLAGKGYFGVLQDVIKWQQGLNTELAKTDNAESWVTILRNLGQFGKYLIEHIDLAGWFRNIGSGSGEAGQQVGYIAQAIAWISRTLAKWTSFLPGVHPPDVGEAPAPPRGGSGGGGGGSAPSIPALPAPITSGPGGGGGGSTPPSSSTPPGGGPSSPAPAPAPSTGPGSPLWPTPTPRPGDWTVPAVGVASTWGGLIDQAYWATGVYSPIIASIMDLESSGRQDAQSPMNYADKQHKVPIGRAQGLMQVMPGWFGVTVGPDGEATTAQKAYMQDPTRNINMGASILAGGFKDYGTWDKSALAYFGALGNPDATDITGTSGARYVALFHDGLKKYGNGWMPPNLALGGIVKATAGGTLATIGEAGRDEAVIPLPSGWRSGGAGVTYLTIDARGAQVYDGSKFEDLMVRALDKAGRGGRILKVTR